MKHRKYFIIAFKVKEKAESFGVSKESLRKLVGSEFGIETVSIIDNHIKEMVNRKFVFAGTNGIRPSIYLDGSYQEFREKHGVI